MLLCTECRAVLYPPPARTDAPLCATCAARSTRAAGALGDIAKRRAFRTAMGLPV